MEKHKSKALEAECKCSSCIFRFQCFTQERVFSDPIYQGLFEAMMAKGMSRDDAIDAVAMEIKMRMGWNLSVGGSYPQPDLFSQNAQCDTVVYDDSGENNVKFAVGNDGQLQVTYTAYDGKEYSWETGINGIR